MRPNVHERFDFEPVPPGVLVTFILGARIEPQRWKNIPPERVVAVAEVAESGPVKHVRKSVEHTIAERSNGRDITRTAPVRKSAALRVLSSFTERGNEIWDLSRVH